MKLYYKPTCPFCLRVINFAQHNGIELDLQNVAEDRDAYAELISKGGKQQVPFLLDEENDVSMYESADIIEYLQKNHGE